MIPQFIGTASAGYDDGNLREVAVEWVEDYPGQDLHYTELNAGGFCDTLVNNYGWTQIFNLGDGDASELHWESSYSGGGGPIHINGYSDFAFFAGHGHPSFFQFGDEDEGGQYPGRVHYTEVNNWGLGDVEWIGLCTCDCLRYDWPTDGGDVFARWGNTFSGLHAIMGFADSALDQLYWWWSAGSVYASYMAQGYTVGSAWERMTIEWQPYTVHGAVLGVYDPNAGFYEFNDYIPGYGAMGADIFTNKQFGWVTWQC
jgi:hypothetical protein